MTGLPPPGFDPSKGPPRPPGMPPMMGGPSMPPMGGSGPPMPPRGPPMPPGMSSGPPMPPGMSSGPPMPPGMSSGPPMPPGMSSGPPMPPGMSSGPPGGMIPSSLLTPPPSGGMGGGHEMFRGGPPMPPGMGQGGHNSHGGGHGGMSHMGGGGMGGGQRGVPMPPSGNMMRRPMGQGGYDSGPKTRHPPRKEPTNTVFLGRSANVQDEDIYEKLRHFGKILRVGRMLDKGVTFVHYATTAEAESAVNNIIDTDCLGFEVQVNYGKFYDYTEAELQQEYRPRIRRGPADSGEDRFAGARAAGREDREHDRRPGEKEPTNVIWVGDLPFQITTELLQSHFAPFGKITEVSRPPGKDMAFIHFDSVEVAKNALNVMRSATISGHSLKLNYGNSKMRSGLDPRSSRPIDLASENPTTVVFLGGLSPDVTESDLDELFDQFPGYINCKHLPDIKSAFGHFETIENATNGRVQLHNYELYGNILKVGFGKTNHNKTMAERFDSHRSNAPGGALALVPGSGGGSGWDGPISGAPGGGMLPREHGQLVLQQQEASALPKYLTRQRPAPSVTKDARIKALMSASYFNCGEADRPLLPAKVYEIISGVDSLIDNEGANILFKIMEGSAAYSLPHLIAIIIKRLQECHADDQHKKMHCFYTASRLVLTESNKQLVVDPTLKPLLPALDYYELLVHLTSIGIPDQGYAELCKVVTHILDVKFAQVEPELVQSLRDIIERKKANEDFSKLLSNF